MDPNRFLGPGGRERVTEALGDAERRTSGEIVPVVCVASGRYDRAEDLVGVVVSLGTLGVFWYLFQGVDPGGGEWSAGPTVALGYWWVALIVLAGFALGAVLATYFPALRLPFIPRSEMEAEVERRAAEAFSEFRVATTVGATGVLIFISIFEHAVVVRGDDAIGEKLAQEDWNGVRDVILGGIRTGKPADGLEAGIRKCGELLARHFPIEADDVDELRNEVRFLDAP